MPCEESMAGLKDPWQKIRLEFLRVHSRTLPLTKLDSCAPCAGYRETDVS